MIKEVTGFEGELKWDASKPDGTPRKLMDNTKINNLGWRPQIELRDGVKQVYAETFTTLV
jgi:GDP-L-fucose synthase